MVTHDTHGNGAVTRLSGPLSWELVLKNTHVGRGQQLMSTASATYLQVFWLYQISVL